MIYKGGKFLGQGTYGCVFFPSIQCHKKKKQKAIFKTGVSKVFKSEDHMQDEIVESNKVGNMDKQGLYTNKMLGHCDVHINDFSRDERTSCKKITMLPLYHQIIYQHKGIDLNEFMKKSYTLPQTYHYILNLLKGLKLLTKHKYCHLDLKPDNILISDSNKSLLIDFGLGRSFEALYNMNKSDYLLEYQYTWYPPEFLLFYDLNISDLDNVIATFVDNNKKKFYGRFLETQIERESLAFLNDVLAHQKINLVKIFEGSNIFKKRIDTEKLSKLFIQKFAPKADVFAIGMIMYYILKNAIKDKNKEEYSALFKLIINKAIRINAYERATIDELINDLEVLMKHTPADALKPLKTNVTKPEPSKPSISKKQNMKTSSSLNHKIDNCMKNKKPQLVAMVDKYKLPKNLKQLNKKPLCEKLVQHIEKDENIQVHPLTSTKADVSFEDCMKYYTLNELKQEVTNKKLPPALKQLKKEALCKELHPHLRNKSNKESIKRGPKRKQ